MKVVLVGSGGREAALAWKLAESPSLSGLVVTGHNPGWPQGVAVRTASTPPEIVAVAQDVGADLVVVGPEAPLADGLADALNAVGIPCFGPARAAARLETSKSFCKEIMAAAGVPTARHIVVHRDDPADVERAERRCAEGLVVIKADGLAAGKGVIVCRTPEEAREGLDQIWSGRFGDAAQRVVLEDLLEGPEVSVFGLCDGERVVGLPSSQDHKRIGDGDTGPNTGGMGAYAPCPLLDAEATARIIEQVHVPVAAELARRGMPFRGVLFAGLMLTADGPMVLEFNVRFGDPECQPLMCLWDDDLLVWLAGVAQGALPEGQPAFREGSACCVVLASAGYPRTSTKGTPIPEPPAVDGVEVFHAGTRRDDDGVLRTNGGRVLGVTGVGGDLSEARDRAYAALEGWRFEGCQLRTDIGLQGLR